MENCLKGELSKAVKAYKPNKYMNSEEVISGSCPGLAAGTKGIPLLNFGSCIRAEALLDEIGTSG